ncbi:unannotated protein [freshwater metagenome]|uniref:Unannotated protein n=1 Tax=freshwater metagenome TaxID=449393 RepID=A0A6J6HGZ9_9ZZZZ|nr:leucine-rich repeat protein [Actinomycetota bacterium]
MTLTANMQFGRIRRTFAAVLVVLVAALALPILTGGTAGADSIDTSGLFTYTSNGTRITITGCTASCAGESVTIPSTIDGLPVEWVRGNGAAVWANGAAIAQLTIPSSVTWFGVESWQGNVASVVFAPNSKVTSLGEFLFANNGRVRSITLPDHLESISQYAFYNAGLDSITLPPTLTSIGSDAFKANRFTEVTIPASVTSYGGAFSANVNITLAPPATSSVTYALDGGSMTSGASAPTQADTVQNTTFTVGNGTDPVKEGFEFGGWNNGSSTYVDGATYTMGGNPVTLTAVWLTNVWTYTVNNGQVDVTGCTPKCADAALTIPSVIEGLPVTSVAKNANFSTGGGHIAQLTIPNSVTRFGGVWQGNTNISKIVFAPNSKITSIDGFQFANTGGMRSIVLPDHLGSIGEYAFYNAGLDSITIPGTVTGIGGEAFKANRFTEVTIPASVTSYGGAFSPGVNITLAPLATSSVTYALAGGAMPSGASAPTQADTLQNTSFTVGNGTDPVRMGYAFGGWSGYWGTVYADGASFPMGGVPETLTAVWVPTFAITYDLNTGTGATPTQLPLVAGGTFQVASGAGLTLADNIFVGWADQAKTYEAGETYTVGSSAVTLTAVWEEVYSVTYDLNGGDGTVPTQSPVVSLGAFQVASGAGLTLADHVFVGWSKGLVTYEAGETFTVGMTAVTLTAVWQRIYSVTYDLNGGAGSTPTQSPLASSGTFQVASGAGLTLADNTFVGWSDGSTTYEAGETFTVGMTAVTLTAVWQRIYSVTYDLNGGAGSTPTQSPLASSGTFQVASAGGISLEGYSFLNWSDGSSTFDAGDIYTIGSSAVTLRAVWAINEAPIPDNVLPPGVDDSMIGDPTNITLSGSTDTTLTLGADGTNASILVPAGALPAGTTLSVYPVLVSAGLANTFPSGDNFVVSLIVTWRAPDGSVPIAGVPVTMTISNAAIKAGDEVYQYFDGVLTLMGTATQDGTISFTFTEDPVFTVSTPVATDDGDGGTPGDGPGPGETPGAGDGVVEDVVEDVVASGAATGTVLPYTGSSTSTPIGIALVLLILGGAMVLATRRKNADLVGGSDEATAIN